MLWGRLDEAAWPTKISNIDTKRAIAERLAERARDGDVIGIGSGSTSYLALMALRDRIKSEGLRVICIPTSHEIETYCAVMGLEVTTLVASRPDWCFDGADEVDPDHNMIKGRGGAFLREQLVFAAAAQRVILVDKSKFVEQLGLTHDLPLGVVPEAVELVHDRLVSELGTAPTVRSAGGKDGGVITEQGHLIMDLALDGSLSASDLERLLLTTPGIAATGLFVGYEFEIIS
ncbi:MAG: ribose 5-phosphate isomerase A [Candidatus Nanopelagicales bacterium]|nr:ribose 5-phosphate isomerase A [Candidatus Nanopelagicales bacterium]